MNTDTHQEEACSATIDGGESILAGGVAPITNNNELLDNDSGEKITAAMNEAIEEALLPNQSSRDASCDDTALPLPSLPPPPPPLEQPSTSTAPTPSKSGRRNPPLEWTIEELRLVSIFRQGMMSWRKKRSKKPKDAPKRPLR